MGEDCSCSSCLFWMVLFETVAALPDISGNLALGNLIAPLIWIYTLCSWLICFWELKIGLSFFFWSSYSILLTVALWCLYPDFWIFPLKGTTLILYRLFTVTVFLGESIAFIFLDVKEFWINSTSSSSLYISSFSRERNFSSYYFSALGGGREVA